MSPRERDMQEYLTTFLAEHPEVSRVEGPAWIAPLLPEGVRFKLADPQDDRVWFYDGKKLVAVAGGI